MDRIEPAERLLNLIIALTNTRTRMTRADIRRTVSGYDGAVQGEDAKADAAFERMFERDKEELRRIGVPLVTVTDSAHGDDIGYRIDGSSASMEPVDLTAAELAVVGLAADYWRGAALGADMQRAVTKVASTVPHAPAVELPFGVRKTAARDALGALAEARHDRRAVRFEYAPSGGAPGVRTVEPWAIVLRGGVEYVVGHDRDRGEPRTFRVSRILSDVTPLGSSGAYDIPDDVPLGMLAPSEVVGTATVAVRPEAGHSLRRRATSVQPQGDWDLLEVPYHWLGSVASEVLALGGAARAVAPEQLVSMVLRAADAAMEVGRG